MLQSSRTTEDANGDTLCWRVTNGPVDLSGGLLEVSGVVPPECMQKTHGLGLSEKVGAVNAPSTYLGLMAGRGSFLKQLQEARVYQEVPGCSKWGEKGRNKYRTFAILKKLLVRESHICLH